MRKLILSFAAIVMAATFLFRVVFHKVVHEKAAVVSYMQAYDLGVMP